MQLKCRLLYIELSVPCITLEVLDCSEKPHVEYPLPLPANFPTVPTLVCSKPSVHVEVLPHVSAPSKNVSVRTSSSRIESHCA